MTNHILYFYMSFRGSGFSIHFWAFLIGSEINRMRLEIRLLFIVEALFRSFVAGADNHCSAVTNSSIWYCWIWAHGQTHPIQRRVVLLQGHRGKQTETPHPAHPRVKTPSFPQVTEDYILLTIYSRMGLKDVFSYYKMGKCYTSTSQLALFKKWFQILRADSISSVCPVHESEKPMILRVGIRKMYIDLNIGLCQTADCGWVCVSRKRDVTPGSVLLVSVVLWPTSLCLGLLWRRRERGT